MNRINNLGIASTLSGLEFLLACVMLVIIDGEATAQSFVKVTSPQNAFVTEIGPNNYTGASWIDYDNDGDLDLFVNNDRLYRNEGGDVFTRVQTGLGSTTLITGNGNSWADYDNDGDLDVLIVNAEARLYRNEGGGSFTRVTDGDIASGTAGRGWAAAWADFNNDGYVDLAITHPAGFVPPINNPTSNHLFVNDGPPNYTLSRVTDTPITSSLTSFTVGSWSDFDGDGDMDYFIGAGPANGTFQPDFLFKNLLKENGEIGFERISEGIIATEQQDGQLWNWVDIDNDGDLDAFLTNWGGGASFTGLANRLYRNDGGSFTKITSDPIVSLARISLSSVWGDFDNDGDLDCYVANDKNQSDSYFRNDGTGSFSRVDSVSLAESLTRRGATAGDYDNDGDLDLAVVGPGTARALFRNDTDNGNNWIIIQCVGTTANRTAIGTKVRAKATVNEQEVWQMREISAQNSFNGHNSLRVHFGFGNATMIDSLVFEWQVGENDTLTNIDTNQLITVTQSDAPTSVDGQGGTQPVGFVLHQNYPNPFNPVTTITFDLARANHVWLTIFDMLGAEVASLANSEMPVGTQTVVWDGKDKAGLEVASGIYFYRLQAGSRSAVKKLILVR